MTLKELAAYLGISSVGSLRTQIERGALKATRAGNQWMVSDEDAEEYRQLHTAGEGRRGRPPKPKEDAC